MRRRKTTKFSGDFNLGTGVFTLECPTPPTLSLAPRARPLTTSQSEHHQLIAPQRSQLCVVTDTAVVTRSGIRLALRECRIDLRLRVLAGEMLLWHLPPQLIRAFWARDISTCAALPVQNTQRCAAMCIGQHDRPRDT